jgi:hypothetical protein
MSGERRKAQKMINLFSQKKRPAGLAQNNIFALLGVFFWGPLGQMCYQAGLWPYTQGTTAGLRVGASKVNQKPKN